MSTAAQSSTPVVPPRPSGRSQEKDSRDKHPMIPPRPLKSRNDRSMSPNHDRFAPSPLNGGFLSNDPTSPRTIALRNLRPSDPIARASSVDLPTVGEEGGEYAAMTPEPRPDRGASPEQTRTVAEGLKLHAPKPSLPAKSAKDRVMTVTRTDSDQAASFGIGKPSSSLDDHHHHGPGSRSIKKKASTLSEISNDIPTDDEHGIPVIGQQVPMYPNAGDVQAPSPGPGGHNFGQGFKAAHHKRKSSSRGLPPGSYGLHGHGVEPHDKLEQVYYSKHPELAKMEHHQYQPDRATDHSMSTENLNKIVHESGRADAISHRYVGTPSEQAGWLALDEAASRPQSTAPREPSHLRHSSQQDSSSEVIHVDEPNKMRHILLSGDAIPAALPEEENTYSAPILAEDEVRKDTPSYHDQPAMQPPPERRGSAFEIDPPHGRSASRPSSRPGSIYKVESHEHRSTPLEDVNEYEPLFPEDENETQKPLTTAQKIALKQRFPSRDIWEDAPTSVHHTTEVSTPDILAAKAEKDDLDKPKELPTRQNETPAQAFARRQEELAEKESHDPNSFLNPTYRPASATSSHFRRESRDENHQSPEKSKLTYAQRFPSRDIWEDTPDSLQYTTTVSTPQLPEAAAESHLPSNLSQSVSAPERKTTDPKDKPSIPERPKPRTASDDTSKPNVPDRPKPQVPTRPTKTGSGSSTDNKHVSEESASSAAAKPKPAVPARSMGGKIAALQAGFMSDLNKKLGLGPQAPKKEESAAEDDVTEEPKAKEPLADARKGRARGPQRRAPAAATASSPSPGPAVESKLKLSFASTVTVFHIDPEHGGIVASKDSEPLEDEVSKSSQVDEEKKTTTLDHTQEHSKHVDGPSFDSGPAVELREETVEKSEKEAEPHQAAAAPKEPEEKLQTLATNTAGETVASTKLEADEKHVEPVKADTEDVAREEA